MPPSDAASFACKSSIGPGRISTKEPFINSSFLSSLLDSSFSLGLGRGFSLLHHNEDKGRIFVRTFWPKAFPKPSGSIISKESFIMKLHLFEMARKAFFCAFPHKPSYNKPVLCN